MPSRTKLYLDSEGVTRGYYVYVHKDCATRTVFYVGKGQSRRAWESTGRNDLWRKKVASLTEGWEVEIVQDDLSEIEAFELERTLVEQYGGASAYEGQLTNRIPGGEEPLAIRLEVLALDPVWSAAYYEAREFVALPRKQQEAIVASVKSKLEPVIEQLSDLEDEADESEDERLLDSVSNVDSIIRSLLDTSSDFLRRRVSWKDFAFAIEDACGDLESELEDADEYHAKVTPLLKQAFLAIKGLYNSVDSGNRKHAEEMAERAVEQE